MAHPVVVLSVLQDRVVPGWSVVEILKGVSLEVYPRDGSRHDRSEELPQGLSRSEWLLNSLWQPVWKERFAYDWERRVLSEQEVHRVHGKEDVRLMPELRVDDNRVEDQRAPPLVRSWRDLCQSLEDRCRDLDDSLLFYE